MQPSSFSNSLMSATTGVKPTPWRRAAVRGADAAISTRSAPSGTTWQPPALFCHRADRREQPGRRQLREQQERAVGQRGHRGLQVQHVAQRDGDHGARQRSQQRAQLADARAVSPPAAPHVHRVAGPAAHRRRPESPALGSRRCAGPSARRSRRRRPPRPGAPGRASTARSSQITTVSSVKTEAGLSSAAPAGSSSRWPPAPRRAPRAGPGPHPPGSG